MIARTEIGPAHAGAAASIPGSSHSAGADDAWAVPLRLAASVPVLPATGSAPWTKKLKPGCKMLQIDVQTVVPVVPHDQQHKHGGSEQPAQGAGWYILRCGSGLDFPAEQAVRDAGWKVFLARERKWRPSTIRRKPVETEYPRFPGYLFLAVSPPCWPDLEAWPFSRYVHGILGMDGQPVAVAPAEMGRLMAEDGQLARPTHMHMAYVPGQTVRVLAGAWRDFTAALDGVDEGGARITVQLFGRPAEVRLPLTWLEAIA